MGIPALLTNSILKICNVFSDVQRLLLLVYLKPFTLLYFWAFRPHISGLLLQLHPVKLFVAFFFIYFVDEMKNPNKYKIVL